MSKSPILILLFAIMPACAQIENTAPVNAEIYAEADVLYRYRNLGGLPAAALERLDNALAVAPADMGLLWRHGRALIAFAERQRGSERRKAFGQAEESLDRLLAINPGSLDGHYWKAEVLSREGRYNDARDEAEKGLAIDDGDPRLHQLLGEALWRSTPLAGRDRARAVAELELALDLSGEQARTYVTLAEAYRDVGRDGDAVVLLDKLDSRRDVEDPAELGEIAQRLDRLRRSLR